MRYFTKKLKEFNLIKKLIMILLIMIILSALTAGIYWLHRINKSYYDKGIFKNLDLSGVDKLMIVAHPDDETIWGGGHLIDGGYLVVCITGGRNQIRKNEFINAVGSLNETNIPIILDFPDKTFGKRDSWLGIKNKISKTVDNLLEMKDWDLIVTHNKDGEYGHIHHKSISKIVSNEYQRLGKNNTLYFFGKYHSKKKISEFLNQMVPLDDELYNKKTEILKIYASQKKVIENLSHMNKYENWIKYNG